MRRFPDCPLNRFISSSMSGVQINSLFWRLKDNGTSQQTSDSTHSSSLQKASSLIARLSGLKNASSFMTRKNIFTSCSSPFTDIRFQTFSIFFSEEKKVLKRKHYPR